MLARKNGLTNDVVVARCAECGEDLTTGDSVVIYEGNYFCDSYCFMCWFREHNEVITTILEDPAEEEAMNSWENDLGWLE